MNIIANYLNSKAYLDRYKVIKLKTKIDKMFEEYKYANDEFQLRELKNKIIDEINKTINESRDITNLTGLFGSLETLTINNDSIFRIDTRNNHNNIYVAESSRDRNSFDRITLQYDPAIDLNGDILYTSNNPANNNR